MKFIMQLMQANYVAEENKGKNLFKQLMRTSGINPLTYNSYGLGKHARDKNPKAYPQVTNAFDINHKDETATLRLDDKGLPSGLMDLAAYYAPDAKQPSKYSNKQKQALCLALLINKLGTNASLAYFDKLAALYPATTGDEGSVRAAILARKEEVKKAQELAAANTQEAKEESATQKITKMLTTLRAECTGKENAGSDSKKKADWAKKFQEEIKSFSPLELRQLCLHMQAVQKDKNTVYSGFDLVRKETNPLLRFLAQLATKLKHPKLANRLAYGNTKTWQSTFNAAKTALLEAAKAAEKPKAALPSSFEKPISYRFKVNKKADPRIELPDYQAIKEAVSANTSRLGGRYTQSALRLAGHFKPAPVLKDPKVEENNSKKLPTPLSTVARKA